MQDTKENIMENLTSGIHSLTVKKTKIIVESRISKKESMTSEYGLHEYDLAVACFERLVAAC
jgi:hypothetical protein